MHEQIFRHRIDLVRQEVMAKHNLDLFLAYADDPGEAGAVRYLTDFDIYAMYALVAVPCAGDVALTFGLHHSAYLIRVKETADADYYLGTYQPGDLCRRLLNESGRTVSAPRIGMVGGKDMFRRIVSNLDKIFPDVTYVPIDAEFWRNAATDSALSRDDRLGRLHRSSDIMREALLVAEDRWRHGSSGSEIAAEVGRAARRRGADILNREMAPVAIAAGVPLPSYLSCDVSNIETSLDAFAIEIRLSYRGLFTSASRTFVAAKEDVELADFREKHRSLCRQIKSGSPIGVIVQSAIASGCVEDNKSPQDVCLGRAIGFSLNWLPELRLGSDELISDLTPFSLGTRLHHPRFGTIQFCDTVLATQSGGEILTDTE
jgi:hypothetical protein